VHIRAARIHEGDRLVGSHGIGQDITEQRAQADRMRVLGAALDQLPEGVRIVDERGEVVYTNASYRRLLGNDTAADPFAAAADGDALRRDMVNALAEDGTWRGVLTCTTAETGHPAPVELVAASVVLAERTLTFALVRDLTDEIARETHLRRAERLASVGTLVTGVAHELNNPLTAIAGFAELMLLEQRSDDDREVLNLTLREATRAAKIVADLRLLATESLSAPSEYGPVDINEIVRQVLKLQRYTLETDSIGIVDDMAPDVAPVHGNATGLEQVVLNLIVNACQALADRTLPIRKITVRTRVDANMVVLRISDSGPGIQQNLIDRIFDPFFTTRSPGDGMGLGLSVVHRIVTDHGGRIEVQSPIGAGAVFVVSLPVSHVAADEPVTETVPRPVNLHVLVVDDEEPIRRALTRYLNRRGHTVDVAADGAAALDLIDSGNFDVILSDLRMPGMGGELMLDNLREHNPSAARRVMFMTGHVARDDASLMSRYADVEVIEKPFSLSEIGQAVEEVAARAQKSEMPPDAAIREAAPSDT
jgi:signal transduction histidine kinase/CheY-like chemotaxis protein